MRNGLRGDGKGAGRERKGGQVWKRIERGRRVVERRGRRGGGGGGGGERKSGKGYGVIERGRKGNGRSCTSVCVCV